MVKVKLFGLLRIDSGIKEFETEAASVKQLFSFIADKAAEKGNIIEPKAVKNCAVLVNGRQADKNTKLKAGDEVVFISMVAGG